MNYYPNHPTRRLYFVEVKTPYIRHWFQDSVNAKNKPAKKSCTLEFETDQIFDLRSKTKLYSVRIHYYWPKLCVYVHYVVCMRVDGYIFIQLTFSSRIHRIPILEILTIAHIHMQVSVKMPLIGSQIS